MPEQQSTPFSADGPTGIQADFRSDTVTQATPAMRQAMAEASVGADVYGEDPTVNALQERIATLAGKEAALFCPSGTQSNLAGILSHCQRGDEFLTGRNNHVMINEVGGAAALGGAVPWPLEIDNQGCFTPEDVRAAVKEPDQHHPVTRLLSLENTVNGHAQSVDQIANLIAAAREHDLAVHLDGARLFNAAVAEGVGIDAYSADTDTVSLCLSKGLGAPVGTVLAGDQASIARAFRLRQLLGGGLRPAGPLAAAGLPALDHPVARLAEDHERARRIADGLRGIDGMEVVQATNMVWATPPADRHDGLVAHLEAAGILLCFWKPTLRIVTHLDVDDGHADLLVDTVGEFLGRT